MITILLLFISLSKTATCAEKIPSQAASMGKPKGLHFALGAGLSMKNNMRKDNTYNNTHGDVFFSPIPLLQLGWGPISFGGQGLKVDLYGNREWGLYTNIDRERNRYHGSGMDDRRDSWFWGVGGRYGKFSAYLGRDIQGRSHGKKFNLNYAEMYVIKTRLMTRSAIGLECFDESYANYYYGVKASEVTANRKEYHPTHFCQPTLSFAPMYKLNEHMTFISALALKGLSREVRHSPTIRGGRIEAGLMFGPLYQF